MANSNGGRGPGRPPHPGPLTPAEVRVHQRIREGLANAEIAVRLGVSINTVRYHVANLLAKSGLANRRELAAWQPSEGERRARAWFGWLALGGVATRAAVAVAAVAIVTGAAVVATTLPSSEPRAAPLEGAPVEATAQTAPLPFPQSADYREFTPSELRDAGFVDTGEFLTAPSNPFPLAESSYRVGFTAVLSTVDGYASYGPDDAWSRGLPPGVGWSSRFAVGLTTTVNGIPLYLRFSGQRSVSTTLLPVGENAMAYYSADPSQPRSVLRLALADADGRYYPIIVDSAGHLWVRPAPVADGLIAFDTGEGLDVSRAERFGPLPGAVGNWRNSTECAGGPCRALIHTHDAGGLPAVAGGEASCDDDGGEFTIELVTAQFRIRFEAVVQAVVTPLSCPPDFPRRVVEGDLLVPHPSWWVTAFAPDGQVSVAADRNWMLYVGGFEPQITTCPPCRN